MSHTKVMLSPKERELVNDADFILTKNAIIQKVYDLFGGLSHYYRKETEKYPALANHEAFVLTPKMAKGENYEGLPWVMLDYPRCFTTTAVFAIRSFFWWGHYCSITLQLSGKFQEQYAEAIRHYFKTAAPQLPENKDWFIGVGEDPWQHHFRDDNYLLLDKQWEDLDKAPYIKLAKKIQLTEWDGITSFYEEQYAAILQMLQSPY